MGKIRVLGSFMQTDDESLGIGVLAKWSGEAWLRALVEVRLAAYDAYCSTCGLIRARARSGTLDRRCSACHQPCVALDMRFWQGVDEKIRAALQRDPALLGRVKADVDGLWGQRGRARKRYVPDFSPLDWLNEAWSAARYPRGRPFAIRAHYQVASEVADLRADAPHANDVPESGDVQLRFVARPERSLSEADWETLRERCLARIGHVPAALGSDDRAELSHVVSWVRDTQADPAMRLRGERIKGRMIGKARRPSHGRTATPPKHTR